MASLKGLSGPSLSSQPPRPPPGFICLKIAQEETTLLLFYTQTKRSGNCTRKPIHLLSLGSAVDGIYYAVHLAPCLCQAACGVKYGWGGRLASQRGGNCLGGCIHRSRNLFITEREAGSYRTAADGRQMERCRCGTESNFASHEPLTAPFHTTPRPGHAPGGLEPTLLG